jgi:hypothetical protein
VDWADCFAERLKTIFKDKLDIGENTLLPHLSRDAIKRQITFDEFLKSLLKQNYLERVSRGGSCFCWF